ncbi:MAG TPA: RNA polymerase sigma factor [Myxococcaceae bacterium]|nr:RNA polymerase sigma factor [Myxococcaceae bacterium]
MAPSLSLRPQDPFVFTGLLRAQLLRRAQNLCRGRFDAEDLVQEVLASNLEAQREGPALPPHAIQARLFVSLKNAFISRLRHAEAGDRFTRTFPEEEPATDAPADQPELPLSERVTDEDLRQAMAALSPKQREVFLSVTGGEPYAAIAGRVGISVGAVGKRVFDARRRLRVRLLELLAHRRS